MSATVPDHAPLLSRIQLLREAGHLSPEADGVPSPCIGVCRMNQAQTHCTGCLRTLDEIRRWAEMPDGERLQVWRVIETERIPAW